MPPSTLAERLHEVDLGRWLHARVVYPAVVRARGEGDVFRALVEMRAAERLSPEALRERQSRRLAALLAYARERSPFYRERLAGLYLPPGGDALEALSALPLVTKAELQESAGRMRARPGPVRVTRKTTGGSTGEAVTLYKDRAALAREMAATWLGYGWFGVGVGDRAVRFWGSPRPLARRLRFAAADFALHRRRFSAFAFDDADLERYWRACLRFRPDYFYGYVSMLEELARHLLRRGHDGRALGLKAVITTSEVLTPPVRALLAEVFGAPVQNEYGCGEVGPIAYACEHGSLHVMSENLVVEVLGAGGRPAAPGETGMLVVTDLNNRALPLVRYRLGDVGVAGGACACGRGFPVLESVRGREYEFVQLPSGRRCHGEFFMYLFEELRERGAGIAQFQVAQTAADRVEVSLVLAPGADARAERRVREAVEARAEGMRAEVRRVDAIERAPSGKMRLIVNPWLRAGAPDAAPAGDPHPSTLSALRP